MKPHEDLGYCELDKHLAVLSEKVAGNAHALTLQEKEYERRLGELKAATDKLEMQNTEQANEIRKWRDSIDRWRWITIGAGMLGGLIVKLLWK